MSKLSFRARALDASKPMPVFKGDEIPALLDFVAVNRAVVEMPTGMEKDEETEHHLQRALCAQQNYGAIDVQVAIPIPEMDEVGERFNRLYGANKNYKPTKQYIHVQPFGMDQEVPDYDMDSDDEHWLTKQVKSLKMDITSLKFENMMDRLEKGSGQVIVTLNEAKALLKEDDDLIMAVYDYWLNKRLKLQLPSLIPQVKTERRDGSMSNNPYVAFRRRTEKMQTRKNRKNDEVSYEKVLKLRKDLNKALILLEMLKRREKTKKEHLKLTVEVVDKRYQMQDWEGAMLAEAEAKKDLMPRFMPLPTLYLPVNREWATTTREHSHISHKKREYKKRKHKSPATTSLERKVPVAHVPKYKDTSLLPHRMMSMDDDVMFSNSSQSDLESDNDPDGPYAFRRKSGCMYQSPRSDGLGGWPWSSRQEGGLAAYDKYKFSLTSLSRPRVQCLGFARQRVGRGGRILLDRAYSLWDEGLRQLDLSQTSTKDPHASRYISHIRTNGISHYHSTASNTDPFSNSDSKLPSRGTESPMPEFTPECFQQHTAKLLAIQRQQRQQNLQQDTDFIRNAPCITSPTSLENPTSAMQYTTLDSVTAQFAVSAFHDINRLQPALPRSTLASGQSSSTVTVASSAFKQSSGHGMPAANGRFGLSTLPAASILQLNYPMNGIQTSSTAPCLSTASRDPTSTKKVVYQQHSSANAAGQLRNTISVPATNSVASFSVAAANPPGPSFVTSSVSSLYVNRPNFVGVNHCRPADTSIPVGISPRCPPIVLTGQRLATRTSSQVLLRMGGVPCSGDKTTSSVCESARSTRTSHSAMLDHWMRSGYRESCDGTAEDKIFAMEVT